MNKGDRVLIRDKNHVWYGQTGVLDDKIPSKTFPGMYRVELDNGMAAGCYLSQLECL